MEVNAVLAWLTLIVAFPLNALAAVLIYRKWRRPPTLRVLKERFVTAVAVTTVALFFGVIFVNNDQTVPPISVEATKLITRTVLLAALLTTAVGWLWLFKTLRRRDSK